MTERLYTLEEAKAELSRVECRAKGHDYRLFMPGGASVPTKVICVRCEQTWTMVPDADSDTNHDGVVRRMRGGE